MFARRLESKGGDDGRSKIRPIHPLPARLVISLLERVPGQRMADRVEDVGVPDAVFARRRVDLHTNLLYYRNTFLAGVAIYRPPS